MCYFTTHEHFWRVIYLAVNRAFLLFFYRTARWAFRRRLFYNARMLFIVSLPGLLGVGFLSWLTLEETNVHSLFSWSMCLVMLFLFYFLLRFYSDYRGERELRKLGALKDRMARQEYESLKREQEERELLAHDMKNHRMILRSMLEENKTDEAKRYLERVSEPFLRLAPVVWTENETLNLFLNQARQRADREKISFAVQADAVSLELMKEEDICGLFANLLDNACESASGEGTGKGWILVKIRKAREMLFVEILNSTAGKPQVKNGALLSAKKDGGLHGLGLLSAQRAAQKYGGELKYEWEDGRFRATVTFLGKV